MLRCSHAIQVGTPKMKRADFRKQIFHRIASKIHLGKKIYGQFRIEVYVESSMHIQFTNFDNS